MVCILSEVCELGFSLQFSLTINLSQSSISWAVCRCAGVTQFLWRLIILPLWSSYGWFRMLRVQNWLSCEVHAPLTQDRPNSHFSVKIAAATLLHTCFHLHSISLFSLSAHCQYDPIGSISHSLCLQHGLGRQLAQPRTYQFTDGGRHRRPGPWQPEQTANHGGVLLKHPEPSHHLSWDHPLVEPLHLGRLSVHFGVLFLFICLCFSFCLFSWPGSAGLMKGCSVWCLVTHVCYILEYFSTAWKHTNLLLMFLPWIWLAYYYITPFFYMCHPLEINFHSWCASCVYILL